MLRQSDRCTLEREQALGDALQQVASELRLIDLADLIAFIRMEQFGNIAALVSASTDLFFESGAICFARSGDVRAGWSESPRVTLDLEFRDPRVRVYFRLFLEEAQAAIEIDYINYEVPDKDPDANTRCLIAALADRKRQTRLLAV